LVKILEATCDDGKVMVGEYELDAESVTIIGGGIGESTGVVFIDGDKVYYMASSSPDIAKLLDSVIEALTKTANTLTAIGAGMTGPTTAPPGALPGNVADINAAIAELNTLKGDLI
jgi:hypothetical protein